MKRNILAHSLPLGLVALLAVAGSLQAADGLARFVAKPGGGSKVVVAGTSTIHDWTMEGTIIGGFLELDPKLADPAVKPEAGAVKAQCSILIPVRSLKSGKQTMDNVYCDAMNEPQNPRIYYTLKELKVAEAPKEAADPIKLSSVGELAVSGTTNQITMDVTLERQSATKLKLAGAIPLKMTDYGVKPPQPAIAGGLIKTGDEVQLTFEWIVEKR